MLEANILDDCLWELPHREHFSLLSKKPVSSDADVTTYETMQEILDQVIGF